MPETREPLDWQDEDEDLVVGSTDGPPEGSHIATLLGTQRATSIDPVKKTPRELRRWELMLDVEGEEVPFAGVTSTKLSKKSNGRKWLEAFLGRPAGLGEVISLDDLVGKKAWVDLEFDSETEYMKVRGVRPLRATRPTLKEKVAAKTTEIKKHQVAVEDDEPDDDADDDAAEDVVEE